MKLISKNFLFHNKKNYFIIFVVFMLFFLIFNTISISTSFNLSKDISSIINVGEMCLFSKYQKESELYVKYEDDFIPVGLSTAKNPNANNTNTNITNLPIFFVEHVDGCVIDYESYIFNSCPEYIEIYSQNGTITSQVKITKIEYNTIGIFLNKNAYYSDYLNYYGLYVTNDNKSDIAHYYNNNYENSKIITYYGDLGIFNKNYIEKEKDETIIYSCLITIIISEIFIIYMLLLSYISINKKSIYSLKIYGLSHKDLVLFSMKNVFLIENISFLIGGLLTLIFASIYNSMKPDTIVGIHFSLKFLISILVNYLSILIFIILIIDNLITKIEKKDDKYI